MSLIKYCFPNTNSLRAAFNEEFFLPALDVAEEPGQYLIRVDLPGVTKEDVRVSFDNGVLTVEGERKHEAEQKERSYHRVERSYGKFARSLELGQEVDGQAVKAAYKDGILTITVPKVERAKPKAVDIVVE